MFSVVTTTLVVMLPTSPFRIERFDEIVWISNVNAAIRKIQIASTSFCEVPLDRVCHVVRT